jgi:uncharacterized protein YaeQ
MALKATIYKAQVQLTDLDRHYYEPLNLTIAQHPSETDERMMVRLLAFILNAHEQLQFTKGLSADDEPEIWQINLTDEVDLWIDLGLPDEKRIRKACSRAKAVKVYSYGAGGADIWWQKTKSKVTRFKHLSVTYLPQESVIAMAQMVKRTMEFQCTIEDGEVWLTDGEASVTIVPELLYPL